ncbi:hypothetical protein VMCG_02035 [Cytospora schulzeri]|uniref:Uncharacterized protein n=1 Tax=Cytospora schulzeri TaxID=448051 RepID=A0A423X3Y8_9PEZI|nr:hypothetical protein VMCG_02035 [Valsa malicola]
MSQEAAIENFRDVLVSTIESVNANFEIVRMHFAQVSIQNPGEPEEQLVTCMTQKAFNGLEGRIYQDADSRLNAAVGAALAAHCLVEGEDRLLLEDYLNYINAGLVRTRTRQVYVEVAIARLRGIIEQKRQADGARHNIRVL